MAQTAQQNEVLVGKKGVMSYVLAAVTQFNSGAKEVRIKARGRAISIAVDVAEIVRNKFIHDAKVRNVSISTEEVKAESGEPTKVSAIEITLGKD
jgi:DNA-binding protein